MRSGILRSAAALALWAMGPSPALAVLRFTGKIESLSGSAILVREGRNVFELRRGPGPVLPGSPGIGDYITIEYIPEVRGIRPAGPAELPGEVPPKPRPDLRDDRLFYPS